jgi:ATP phosphoribosyltransferase
MAEDTMDLLADCQLKVRKINPRQYAAEIPNVPGMEVWFQRATDVVRKLISGDVDIGIVGYDMLREIGNEDPDLVVVHDALGFGGCHLAVAVPNAWEDVNSLRDLMNDKRFTKERPLRVVTAYMNLAEQFFREQGMTHVVLSTADGALEAAPAMGAAAQGEQLEANRGWPCFGVARVFGGVANRVVGTPRDPGNHPRNARKA